MPSAQSIYEGFVRDGHSPDFVATFNPWKHRGLFFEAVDFLPSNCRLFNASAEYDAGFNQSDYDVYQALLADFACGKEVRVPASFGSCVVPKSVLTLPDGRTNLRSNEFSGVSIKDVAQSRPNFIRWKFSESDGLVDLESIKDQIYALEGYRIDKISVADIFSDSGEVQPYFGAKVNKGLSSIFFDSRLMNADSSEARRLYLNLLALCEEHGLSDVITEPSSRLGVKSNSLETLARAS